MVTGGNSDGLSDLQIRLKRDVIEMSDRFRFDVIVLRQLPEGFA